MARRSRLSVALLVLGALALGCERERAAGTEAEAPAPLVEPPFALHAGAEDLLFTYFDAEGPHTVDRLDEVPADRRAQVAVRSLSTSPEARPEAGQLFVADLRAPASDGRYAVRLVPRDDFDRWVDEAAGRGATEALPTASVDVVLYGASWCGACRSAAAFLRAEGIAFEEKDIERDPAAREEMMRKLRAQGMPAGGIPVIDFRGTLVQGFDRAALEGLMDGPARPI